MVHPARQHTKPGVNEFATDMHRKQQKIGDTYLYVGYKCKLKYNAYAECRNHQPIRMLIFNHVLKRYPLLQAMAMVGGGTRNEGPPVGTRIKCM